MDRARGKGGSSRPFPPCLPPASGLLPQQLWAAWLWSLSDTFESLPRVRWAPLEITSIISASFVVRCSSLIAPLVQALGRARGNFFFSTTGCTWPKHRGFGVFFNNQLWVSRVSRNQTVPLAVL